VPVAIALLEVGVATRDTARGIKHLWEESQE